MEPVSLGVGIAGAISASISIGTALKKVTQQYRDAPDSYTFTIKQCSAVSGQLSLLQSLMLQESWSVKLGHDGETSDYFVTIVMNCAENLQELESCVASIRLGLPDADGKAQGIKQKVKIMWREEDVKTLLGRLETSKADIGRVLTIVQAGSLARIETQMDQLKKSMDALARSKSTKYRAMRVPGGGVGGSESSIVVVPSTYPGAPPKESVAGSGVSLSDIDLSSVVLTTTADDMSIRNEARGQRIAASIKSFLPMAGGGLFGNQMQALVDAVEQDRVSMQKQLSEAHESLAKRNGEVDHLSKLLIDSKQETQSEFSRTKSEMETQFAEKLSREREIFDAKLHETVFWLREGEKNALVTLEDKHAESMGRVEADMAYLARENKKELELVLQGFQKEREQAEKKEKDLEQAFQDFHQRERDDLKKKRKDMEQAFKREIMKLEDDAEKKKKELEQALQDFQKERDMAKMEKDEMNRGFQDVYERERDESKKKRVEMERDFLQDSKKVRYDADMKEKHLEQVLQDVEKELFYAMEKTRKIKLEKAALLRTLHQATDTLRSSNSSYNSLLKAYDFALSRIEDIESAAAHLLNQRQEALEFLDKQDVYQIKTNSVISELSNSLAQLVTDKFIEPEELPSLHVESSSTTPSPIPKGAQESTPTRKPTSTTRMNSPPNATNSSSPRSSISGTTDATTATGASVDQLHISNPIKYSPTPAPPVAPKGHKNLDKRKKSFFYQKKV